MKQLFFVLCLCCMTAFQLHAQQNIIKTNPIGLAFGNFNATYERVLNESSSVLVSANYFYQLLGIDVNSFGMQGAYRYYFTHKNKDVPSGFYVNPQIGFQTGNAGDSVSYSTVSVGGEVGYQWAWPSGFALDLGIGPNFVSFGGDYEDADFDISGGSGVVPSITIAIGYAF